MYYETREVLKDLLAGKIDLNKAEEILDKLKWEYGDDQYEHGSRAGSGNDY